MAQKHRHFSLALILSLLLSLAACGGGGGDTGGTTPPPSKTHHTYVYVSNYDDDTISQFSASTSFGLTEILPAANTANFSGPNSLTAGVDGKYLYAVNQSNSTIDKFTVSANGALTDKVTISTGATTWPWSMAIESTGRSAYVVYSNTNEIEQYSLDANGALSSPAGPQSTGANPNVVTITPSGRYAYVANSGDDTISAYQIDPITGAITALTAPNDTISTGTASTPLFLSIDPFGRYLYTANNGGTVGQFSIAADGILTAIPNQVSISGDPSAIAVDPTGRYVYVTDWLNDRVLQYTIRTDANAGALVILDSDPTGRSPIGIDIDPESQYVYTINEINPTFLGSISQYRLNAADGKLIPVFTDKSTGVLPTWIKAISVLQ